MSWTWNIVLGLSSTPIQVWDNVLSKQTCHVLHEAASASGLGHRVFSRSSSQPRTIIEQALDSILSEINDSSPFVEYWSRQEWRSIEAHADVDEHLAKQDPNEPFRYPVHGHVLYLQVGTNVRGPTCVFTDVHSGGDLLRHELVELSVVPAVPGRLLRFQGDLLHAVPRPTDLWLLPYVKGAPQFEPTETWGRSVVLFNTWKEPPSNVPFSDSKGDECQEEEAAEPSCRALDDWRQQQVTAVTNNPDSVDRVNAKVWLLGDQRRRDHTLRTVKVSAPDTLRDALESSSQPQRLTLTQP